MKTNFATKALAIFVMAAFTSFNGFAQETPQLTDPEIAKVAVVANQIDIDYARLAIEKSKNPDVREFASTMLTDHQAIIKQAVALVTKLGVVPEDNKVSQSLVEQADKTVKELNAKKGAAFDEAYIDNEVSYHKAVVGAVKDLLIPQSQNAELKALLETALSILETHLEHAEMAQRTILKK